MLLPLSHFSCVRLCATPWTVAHQAPPSMGFSRQEYWSGVPLLLLYNIVVVFAIHSHESAMDEHVLPILNPRPTSIPQGHPSAPALSTLSHISNLDWRSISHTIIYMFQCYSLKSPHPRLLPQSPKVCSLHLCPFCCLAYRVIITIFLNSIYMR